MITTRLKIGDNDNVAIIEGIPIIKTYDEADVREPQNKKTSFAKAIQLYGSDDVNILFENIFEVNIATQYFNANLKTQVIYYENEVETFRGYLQLLRITLTPDNNIVYDCNIVGETGNFWTDIGDALLTDLDYSDLDHDYTRDNIINSWDTSIIRSAATEAYSPGNGYYYPLVNRGTILGDETIWRVRDFLPCIYNYEYLKKIFENLGYTWNSSFLESEFFKRQITYPNIDTVILSQTELDNRQFNVGRLTDLTLYNTTGNTIQLTNTNLIMNRETSPFFDVGANYSGFQYNVPQTGTYNFNLKTRLKFTITHTNPAAVFCSDISCIRGTITNSIKRFTTSSSVLSSNALNYTQLINTVTGLPFSQDNFKTYFENGTSFYCELSGSTGDVLVNSGDLIKAENQLNDIGFRRTGTLAAIEFFDVSMNQIFTGSVNFKIELVADINNTMFYGLVTSPELSEGDTLEMNNAIPTNIKQKDFVKSIMQLNNLIMQPNKDNPKELIIEQYADYYNTEVDESWMNILDTSKDVIVNPMSELDAKSYIFKYKSDKDYYNRTFEENFKQPFGTHREILENDFIKATNTNELIWSPTPNIANYALGIAYPKIYDLDGATVKRITPNIRNLYAEIKSTTGAITFKEEGGSDIIIQSYGYAGHTDDPFNPTIDLNFGTPLQVFYSYINAQFTDNNQYNRCYKPFIDQISHRDSKLVIANLYLDEKKIKEFSFRKTYPILGKDKTVTYYRVNKILEYKNSSQSTPCELLKLADTQAFTPTNYDIYSIPTYSTERLISTPLSTPSRNVQIYTEYPVNVSASEDVIINRDCQRISVVASRGINIAEDLVNVSVINSSNLTITESNVTYVDGVNVSQLRDLKSVIHTTTINYSLTRKSGNELVDCTSGNRIITLPDVADCITTDSDGNTITKILTIIKIDSSGNTVTITPTSGTINGVGTKVLSTQYECVTIQTDGVNWFII